MTYKHEARRSSTVWILVADRARARVFAGEWPELDDVREIETFVHPESTVRQHDVESDGPGRFPTPGGAHQIGEAETDFKHRTASDFSRQVIHKLQDGKDSNAYGRLVIVAPALFLGVLRDQLSKPIGRQVVAEIDKDLTHLTATAIRAEVHKAISLITQPTSITEEDWRTR